MNKVSLRIADLRKKTKVTQQELADSIGVSFQTISKWETVVNMPDITILPLLADYFKVSTDQLLGLKPLDGETYIPEKTATKEFWNQKLEYLLRTRKSSWNDDYARFLISQVWKIDKPISVLDCGCGYGFLGLLLLPYLPDGITYTGIDFAEPDGYVVCIDANREFECCGLYIDGMDYQELCKHDGLEKKWQTELAMQGRDYAVAIRTAHMMQKLGLVDVEVRMNDKVEFITTQSANYEETKNDFIAYNDWTSGISEEEKEKLILHLLTHGLSRKEAEDYCSRNIEIANFFADNPTAGYTFDHFDRNEHNRLTRAFREECLFTKAGNGELCSDEFLSLLGYPNPTETMRDYLTNYLTLDQEFLWFAERNYKQYDFVLLSNDVKEWSKYLFELHGLQKYFKESIISGEIRMRKPENRIFVYTIKHLQCNPQECVFVDNSVQNLNAAQEAGINTVLFNRDNEAYSGDIVNNFHELDSLLKNIRII